MARKPFLHTILRSTRERRGMSVAELARSVGVSAVAVYYWEQGRVRPRDYNLRDACKALRLPIKATTALPSRR